MSAFDLVFTQPELVERPPVLVDIGAAAGVHRAWRPIARYAVALGFEPDAREAQPLTAAQRQFRKFVFCPAIAWPGDPPAAEVPFHLTRSPQCSSVLAPDPEGLAPWAFAEIFQVARTERIAAVGLRQALMQNGLERIDWLKCDTQGLDLRLFLSLPESLRQRISAVEFEPGLLSAYAGEDRIGTVLTHMETEPFWLASFRVQPAVRANAGAIASELGSVRRVQRYGPEAPGWVNACWLRDVRKKNDWLDRRGRLLAWVFSTLLGQDGEALFIARTSQSGAEDPVFARLAQVSRRRLRLSLWRRMPLRILRRMLRPWSA